MIPYLKYNETCSNRIIFWTILQTEMSSYAEYKEMHITIACDWLQKQIDIPVPNGIIPEAQWFKWFCKQLDAKWEYRWRGESSNVFETWWVVNGSKVLVETSVNEKMKEK